MTQQIGIAEFLDKVGKLSKTSDKIAALKANDSLPLRIIMQGAYDPNVVWIVPEGRPPYKANELHDQEHVLIHDCSKLKYFIKGFGDNIKPVKREVMFLQFLERLAPKDAEMIVNIKDKKPFPGITVAHVREALPDLFPEFKEPETNKIVDVKHDTVPFESLLPEANTSVASTSVEEVVLPIGADDYVNTPPVVTTTETPKTIVTKTVTTKKKV